MRYREIAAVLAGALLLGGCATGDEAMGDAATGDDTTDTPAASEAQRAEPLPDWRKMWDFGDPAASEARFREAVAAGEAAGDATYVAVLLTQLGRTQGLQRRFDDAHATLDRVEGMLGGLGPEVRVRYLLERGRTLNSSGRAPESVPLFEEAWEVARAAGLDALALDAAHMLGIALPSDRQLAWAERAIALAEASEDPRCKVWLGPLYNNTGWTYHDLGRYDDALAIWEKSLAFRQQQGAAEETFIARWTIARCWRSMGRHQDALAEQQSVLTDRAAAGMPSTGYCEEEIGENLLALGRDDEARAWFGKAWDLLKDDAWLQADESERLARMKQLGGR